MFSLLWINSEHTVNRVSVSQDRRQKQFWWKQYCIYFHSTGVEAHRKHSILSFRWGMGEVLHASSSEYLPLSQCRPFSRPLRHEEVLQRQTVGSDDPLAKTVRTGRIDRDRHGSKVNPGSALSLSGPRCRPKDLLWLLTSRLDHWFIVLWNSYHSKPPTTLWNGERDSVKIPFIQS